MSAFPKETIKNIGESVGVVNLKDDAASSLAQDVEYRIHELIQEATKFMRHSRRSKLSVDDINAALRVKNLEPLYGYACGDAPKFRKTIVNNSDIYFAEDEEVDFETILNRPLPKIPLDVNFTAHWLAIEGVQPAIPQNPTPSDAKVDIVSKRSSTAKNHTAPIGMSSDQVDVKPLVKHVLSKELQMYFERITEAVVSDDERLQSQAFESLRNDPGLHQLLPYFVQHIEKKVRDHHKHLDVLDAMLSMSQSLLSSKHLFIEPYLHQLIPPIMTCLAARKICEHPQQEDHWAIRRRAAAIIADLCDQYGSIYHTLRPRISKTLLRKFLDPSEALTTQYGAIVGLDRLGPEVGRVLIVPNIKVYSESCLASALDDDDNELRASEAQMCRDALVDVLVHTATADPDVTTPASTAAGSETRMDVDAPKASAEERNELIDRVGEIVGTLFLERCDGKAQVQHIIQATQ